MEIQVGEYIRTKDGYIGKVCNENLDSYLLDRIVNKEIDGCETIRDYCFWKDEIEKYNITKHSFNIIDLIEEGDYVNGQKVVGVSSGWIDTKEDIIRKDHIKSIVTHEQMEAMEYEVK